MLHVDIDPSLREKLKKTAVSTDDADVIRRITMVGAFRNTSRKGMLGGKDQWHLSNVFDICRRGFIPVAPTVDISIANLFYGEDHDFLASQQPCDMVIMSYVYYNPDQTEVRNDNGTLQSPHATDPDLWRSALLNTGAHTVFNIVNQMRVFELPTAFLEHPPFELVGTTSKRDAKYSYEYDLLVR